jgi:type II secretory pathway pseudopilin PulG
MIRLVVVVLLSLLVASIGAWMGRAAWEEIRYAATRVIRERQEAARSRGAARVFSLIRKYGDRPLSEWDEADRDAFERHQREWGADE